MKAGILIPCILIWCAIVPSSSFLPAGSRARYDVIGRGCFTNRASTATTQQRLSRTRRRVDNELAPRQTVRCFFGFGGGAKKGPPANYDEITSQAIAAVQAGLKAGEKAMEVEFPPLASLNKLNDGSAKNSKLAQASTLSFAKKRCHQLVGAIGRGKKVYVVCCEPGAKAALGKGVGGADVRNLDAKNLPPAKAGDVQVFITPADQGQWNLAKKMSETSTVVIVNGVFVNGYMPFEPVYYFKPISGWGSVVRQYPGGFTAYVAGSNKEVPCEAGLVRQGDIRRPDLRTAANALSAAFKEQEASR